MSQPVNFYSEGFKLFGDIYLPTKLGKPEKRPGIVLCHDHIGVRHLYLPQEIAHAFTSAGYVVLTFDYKGWAIAKDRKPPSAV